MNRRAILICVLAVAGAGLCFGLAHDSTRPTESREPTTRPDPIRYEHFVRRDPLNHVHVLRIDLTDPTIRIRVCPGGDDPDGPEGPWHTTLQTTSEIARKNGLFAAVNGNFFTCKEARKFAGRTIPYFVGNWARVQEWAMSDGKVWSSTHAGASAMVISANGRVQFGQFRPTLPPDAREVVGGASVILTAGRVTAIATERAPRSAVGLDREGKTLIFVVVDGRKTEYSAGMSEQEMAKEMLDIGCWYALMLDGGGSSTMVMEDPIEKRMRVMNRPSDGHDLPISLSIERPVACVIGVQRIAAYPK